MKKYLYIIGLIFLTINLNGQEVRISTTGVLDFNHGFLSLNEAGTDFQSPVISSTNLYLSLQYENFIEYFTRPDKKWRIAVSKEDVSWHQNLSVEVKRDGNGGILFPWFSARNPLVGGTNYIEIPNNGTTFFEGEHGYSDIPIKVSLVGASVIMGAGDYSTTVYFTVYDR